MGNPCWMLSAEADVWSCSCLHIGVLWGCRDNGKGNGNYCIIMEYILQLFGCFCGFVPSMPVAATLAIIVVPIIFVLASFSSWWRWQ